MPPEGWWGQTAREQGLRWMSEVEQHGAHSLLKRARAGPAQPALQSARIDAVEVVERAFVTVDTKCDIEPGEQRDRDHQGRVALAEIVGWHAVNGLSGVSVLPALLGDAERDEVAAPQVERARSEQAVRMPVRARASAAPVERAVREAFVGEPEAGEAGSGDTVEQLEGQRHPG